MEAETQVTDVLDPLSATLRATGASKPVWYRLIREGKAPAPIKIGRSSRWSRMEVQRWISDRKAERGVAA